MSLTEERSRRIGAMLAAIHVGRGGLLPSYFPPRGSGTQAQRRRLGLQRDGSASFTGPAVAQERSNLELLVRSGRVSQTEADAYLAAKYPGQRISGGRYQDQAQALAAERASGLTASLAVADVLLEARADVQRAPGRDPTSGTDAAVSGDQPVRAQRVPDDYAAPAVQSVLDNLAEEVSRGLREVRLQPPVFPAHSLSGDALALGSVPAEALDPVSVGEQLLALPGASEAIEIDAQPSLTLDRYVVNGVDKGPGRIWQARPVERQARTTRFSAGPERFRLLMNGQKFGVMSVRMPPTADLSAQLEPGLLFQYGIVIRGIRHYLGRPPLRLLALESIGDSPVAFRTLFSTGSNNSIWATGGTNRDFYWNRTTSEHFTNAPYPFAEAFGTDTDLAPNGGALRDIAGFQFQLITGRTGGEVFRQLCSRVTLGRSIRSDGHGPALTIPSGLPIEAPTVPNCVDWDSPTLYTHRPESYDLTTAGTRIVIGMPFRYEDCASLVATDTEFSLVVMPIGEKLVSQTTPPLSSYGQPELWAQNGIRLTDAVAGSRRRRWAVDMIVE